jgi:hypothetical protein
MFHYVSNDIDTLMNNMHRRGCQELRKAPSTSSITMCTDLCNAVLAFVGAGSRAAGRLSAL